MAIPFIGSSKSATTVSSSTLFGYIFGTSSYTGGTATKQYYSSGSSVTYYIPSSLKTVTVTGGNILYGAFYNCSSLTNVIITDTVTSIGNYAFSGCSSLTGIIISDSVTSIGYRAFYDCSGLISVTFNNISGWKVSTSIDMSNPTSLLSSNLTKESIAAQYLKLSNYYRDYYWQRG